MRRAGSTFCASTAARTAHPGSPPWPQSVKRQEATSAHVLERGLEARAVGPELQLAQARRFDHEEDDEANSRTPRPARPPAPRPLPSSTPPGPCCVGVLEQSDGVVRFDGKDLSRACSCRTRSKLTGPTTHTSRPPYKAHPGRPPLSLQDHSHLSVRFRSIWIRELPA